MYQESPAPAAENVIVEELTLTYPRFLEIRLYLIISLILAASITLPFALHLFGIAGQVFLPIYLFSLLAGLAYGSRCGFLVGLLAPLVSFSIAQMPPAGILPFVIAKAVSLGLVSGLFTEIFSGRKFYLTAVIATAFALLNGNLLLYILSQNMNMARMDFAAGYPGIFLLLTAVPFIASKITHYERKIIRRYHRQIKTA